jgi:hypothetical protein
MQHQTSGSLDGQCQSVRDRVIDGEKLDFERAEPFGTSLGDLQLVGLDAVLDELLLDQGQGQP